MINNNTCMPVDDIDNIIQHYTLDENNNPVRCSLREWASLYMRGAELKRRVGWDKIKGIVISTVFTGHAVLHPGIMQMLFETMIFNHDTEIIYSSRYRTWDEAREGHLSALEWVKNGCKEKKV